jgi:formylmethanofuran dehydrogenase subunit D
MCAEFETIKISLGDLKDIQEGLVVDVSSVYNNNVSLKVGEQVVAEGELVIVNDRYGVKVTKVTADKYKTDSVEGLVDMVTQAGANVTVAPNSAVQSGGMPQADVPAGDGGDEFDYSDFDVDE